MYTKSESLVIGSLIKKCASENREDIIGLMIKTGGLAFLGEKKMLKLATKLKKESEEHQIQQELNYLKEIIGSKAFYCLRRGGLLQIWRRSSPSNWWIAPKKREWDYLWHSSPGESKPNLNMFNEVYVSKEKIGDGLPETARLVIGSQCGNNEHSMYQLKKEYLP